MSLQSVNCYTRRIIMAIVSNESPHLSACTLMRGQFQKLRGHFIQKLNPLWYNYYTCVIDACCANQPISSCHLKCTCNSAAAAAAQTYLLSEVYCCMPASLQLHVSRDVLVARQLCIVDFNQTLSTDNTTAAAE